MSNHSVILKYLLNTYSVPGMVLSFRENIHIYIYILYTHTELYHKVNFMERGENTSIELHPHAHITSTMPSFESDFLVGLLDSRVDISLK